MRPYVIVIPARLKSSRLPNKPLIKILGREMILRTIDQCRKVTNKKIIYVATDSIRLRDFLIKNKFYNVIITSSKCKTGTDRIYEFSKKIVSKYYINVQGDEPLVNPYDIKKIIKQIKLKSSKNKVINGYAEITKERDYKNSNIPKVVFSSDKKLLYMSRSNIPSSFKKKAKMFKQICIYAFPKKILQKVFKKNIKSNLESYEDIEILRFLEKNIDIKMIKLSGSSMSVDVPRDIKEVEKILKKNE